MDGQWPTSWVGRLWLRVSNPMKLNNPGPAHCLADISNGMTREQVRAKWLAGEYGEPGFRPRRQTVDEWLKFVGK